MNSYIPRLRLLPVSLPKPDELIALADRLHWTFYEERTGKSSEETIWSLGDGVSVARWMADRVINLAYLQFEGPLAAKTAQAARSQIAVVDEADVAKKFSEATDDETRMLLLRMAAVVTSYEVFQPDIFAMFQKSMHDSNPAVREMAAFAAIYPGWREFEPPLEVLTHDADDGVRETASRALHALRTMRWSAA